MIALNVIAPVPYISAFAKKLAINPPLAPKAVSGATSSYMLAALVKNASIAWF
jgi:hypothetical protein